MAIKQSPKRYFLTLVHASGSSTSSRPFTLKTARERANEIVSDAVLFPTLEKVLIFLPNKGGEFWSYGKVVQTVERS